MKRKYIIVFIIAILAFIALGLAACDDHKHTLEHVAAIESSCETEGHTEHWFCAECGKYFSDEQGKVEISYSDVVIHVLGHDRQEVKAVSPTCSKPGNTAGYSCTRCDYTTVQTLPPSHDMTYHAGVPGSCLEDGVKEYWTCSREPGVYYANETGSSMLYGITIYATGHDMMYCREIPAGCAQDGVKSHWACSHEPGVYYADEEGNETLDDFSIPAIGHDMTYVEGLSATCTENGLTAHWVCAREQGVYYANEQGTKSFANAVIPATGHDLESSLTSNDTHHWYVCKNGCGEECNKEAHDWGDGVVTKEPTTMSDGEQFFTCEICNKEKTQIIPKLGKFNLTVVEDDIYNNEDGGSISVESDKPLEGGKYVEGSVITVTATLNESFGIGYVYLNDNEYINSPLAQNGVCTFRFVIKEDTTLTVEFGKIITTTRKWQLRDGSGLNFAYPWEYYSVDSAQNGNGTAMLYVYDATEINALEHDFTADTVLFTRELYQALSWSVFDDEAFSALIDFLKKQPSEEQRFDFTLAFAIRLFPSAAKHNSGYVASELVLPTATTVGGVEYHMTADYVLDLSAPDTRQFRINDEGTAIEFLREGGAGTVFTTYHAAYIEIEMRSEDGSIVRSAYMFNENGTLIIYSNLEKSGTPLSCSSVNNAWINTSSFNNWAMGEYSDAYISATYGWEFRTKVYVDENSYWLQDGEWSEVIKYVGFSNYVAPSFKQMDFNNDGSAIEFIRLGGKGLLFTKYHASGVEIEVKKGDTVYTMYLFYSEQNRHVYLYANSNQEGERLDCNTVDNASVKTVDLNIWASMVFEENFNAHEWEYRTKVLVNEDNYETYWFEDGDWSEVIKYGL